jgi:hypothetical protein
VRRSFVEPAGESLIAGATVVFIERLHRAQR